MPSKSTDETIRLNWLSITIAQFIWFLGGLYTAFVLKNLWDWFATMAFHVHEISYWTMYGVNLFISFAIAATGANTTGQQLKEIFLLKLNLEALVSACVPENKKEELREEIKFEQGNFIAVPFGQAIGAFVGGTITLAIGFFVHMFLV